MFVLTHKTTLDRSMCTGKPAQFWTVNGDYFPIAVTAYDAKKIDGFRGDRLISIERHRLVERV